MKTLFRFILCLLFALTCSAQTNTMKWSQYPVKTSVGIGDYFNLTEPGVTNSTINANNLLAQATNGLVGPTITNGFATTNWAYYEVTNEVHAATNGFIASISGTTQSNVTLTGSSTVPVATVATNEAIGSVSLIHSGTKTNNFALLSLANAAAVTGDTIVVNPGNINESDTIFLSAGIAIKFEPGSSITWTSAPLTASEAIIPSNNVAISGPGLLTCNFSGRAVLGSDTAGLGFTGVSVSDITLVNTNMWGINMRSPGAHTARFVNVTVNAPRAFGLEANGSATNLVMYYNCTAYATNYDQTGNYQRCFGASGPSTNNYVQAINCVAFVSDAGFSTPTYAFYTKNTGNVHPNCFAVQNCLIQELGVTNPASADFYGCGTNNIITQGTVRSDGQSPTIYYNAPYFNPVIAIPTIGYSGLFTGNGSGLTNIQPSGVTNAAGFWLAAPAGTVPNGLVTNGSSAAVTLNGSGITNLGANAFASGVTITGTYAGDGSSITNGTAQGSLTPGMVVSALQVTNIIKASTNSLASAAYTAATAYDPAGSTNIFLATNAAAPFITLVQLTNQSQGASSAGQVLTSTGSAVTWSNAPSESVQLFIVGVGFSTANLQTGNNYEGLMVPLAITANSFVQNASQAGFAGTITNLTYWQNITTTANGVNTNVTGYFYMNGTSCIANLSFTLVGSASTGYTTSTNSGTGSLYVSSPTNLLSLVLSNNTLGQSQVERQGYFFKVLNLQ